MIFCHWTVFCDGCGWWDDRTVGDTKTEAVAGARAAGWIVGKRVVCTACQKKGEKS